jgi:hypothetical protein
MEKVTCDTASIVQDAHCKDCGWPIIHACANWDTEKFPTQEHINKHPDDECYDWWGYCTNKSCINHHGKSWDQELPEFIVYQQVISPSEEEIHKMAEETLVTMARASGRDIEDLRATTTISIQDGSLKFSDIRGNHEH